MTRSMQRLRESEGKKETHMSTQSRREVPVNKQVKYTEVIQRTDPEPAASSTGGLVFLSLKDK